MHNCLIHLLLVLCSTKWFIIIIPCSYAYTVVIVITFICTQCSYAYTNPDMHSCMYAYIQKTYTNSQTHSFMHTVVATCKLIFIMYYAYSAV